MQLRFKITNLHACTVESSFLIVPRDFQIWGVIDLVRGNLSLPHAGTADGGMPSFFVLRIFCNYKFFFPNFLVLINSLINLKSLFNKKI